LIFLLHRYNRQVRTEKRPKQESLHFWIKCPLCRDDGVKWWPRKQRKDKFCVLYHLPATKAKQFLGRTDFHLKIEGSLGTVEVT
jgi:hypothetical protein